MTSLRHFVTFLCHLWPHCVILWPALLCCALHCATCDFCTIIVHCVINCNFAWTLCDHFVWPSHNFQAWCKCWFKHEGYQTLVSFAAELFNYFHKMILISWLTFTLWHHHHVILYIVIFTSCYFITLHDQTNIQLSHHGTICMLTWQHWGKKGPEIKLSGCRFL